MKKLIIIPFLFLSIVLNSQEIKFGKVSKEELTEKTHPIDSTAEAAYLYKQKKINYEYDGDIGWTIVTKVHERIKIYTAQGYKFATKYIKLYKRGGKNERLSNLKAYTFQLDKGDIKKSKFSKKNIFTDKATENWELKKITMPNIREGVVLDIRYQIISPYHKYIDQIDIQNKIPIKKIDINVKIPEYFVFRKHLKGYLPINIENSEKNRKISFSYRTQDNQSFGAKTTRYNKEVNLSENIISIKENNIPAIKNESYVANLNNYNSRLVFEISHIQYPNSQPKYYSTTWEDVSKKIYKSSNFGVQLEKQRYFKDDLNTILKNAKNNTDKIALIFGFVKNKVKWNKKHTKYTNKGVKKAYKEGTGNVAEINLMLTGMLRSIGLDANPVLVSTKSNGIPLFPTFNGFNYVISKVNFSDQSYILLDASEKHSTLNTLPIRCLNWNGREIHKNGTSNWVSLIPKKHAKEINTLHVKINDDFSINGMLRTVYTGHVAMLYRDKNNIKKEEDVITALEGKHTIEIENFKSLNKTALSKNIVQSFKFDGDDFVENINNKIYITPLLFLTQKENPFKSNERNFPIDFNLPWQDKYTVSLNIPEGYTIQSIPEPLAIGLPENLGVFKFQVMHKGNKIKVMSVLQINSNIISPQYYSILKDFYKQLVSKQNEKIVLLKK
ncbi:transglutaminase domain-containing protein [Tenacibaculum halocynthiae]|uniref:transglutaminase domain-containing protein n=1 Tax=Tenacibaculum halocynthiae TaxID=1254437 RepID=UPI003D6501ED